MALQYEDRVYDIYLVTNQINKKQYVGQTCTGFQRRWNNHINASGAAQNCKLYKAIKKYQVQNFTIELLEQVIGITKANEREIFYIEWYNTYHEGYNETIGGQYSYNAKWSQTQIDLICERYRDGLPLKDIAEEFNTSVGMIGLLRRQGGEPKRERTEHEKEFYRENIAKATKSKQVAVECIEKEQIFESKKAALVWLMEEGYSAASDWHNIRQPLDKALKNPEKTFNGFHWRLIDGE